MFRAKCILSVLCLLWLATPARATWYPGGNPLCMAPGYQGELIALPIPGGITISYQSMFAFWADSRDTFPAGSDLYFQLVGPLGPDDTPDDGTVAVTAPGFQAYADACATGAFGGHPPTSGGVVVAWADNRNGALDVYAKRLLDSINTPWPSDGVPVCLAGGVQHEIRVVGDAAAGATLAWLDQRSAFNSVYAQRLDADGSPQWAADGIAVCTMAATRFMLRLAPAPGGGVFMAWLDSRSGPMNAFVMRIDSDGSPAAGWTANGVLASNLTLSQLGPLVTDDAGGVFVTGQTTSGHSWVCRLDGDGGVHAGWPAQGALLNATPIEGGLQDAVRNGDGLVVAWVQDIDPDFKATNFDLYAQRILADGSRPAGWAADGNVLCDAPGDQGNARLADAPAIIAVWEDSRPGSIGQDLYAMRLEADGDPDPAWTPNGVVIASGNGRQFSPRPVWDGLGGVMIAYVDDHDFDSFETDILAQIVNFSGRVEVPMAAASGFGLSAVHPNPARSQVSVELSLAGTAAVDADVLDVLGRRVRVLDSGAILSRTLRWDLTDGSGQRVEPGIYFIRARTATESRTRAVVVRR